MQWENVLIPTCNSKKEIKMQNTLSPEDLASVEISLEELIRSGEFDPTEISMGTYTNNGGRRDKDG